MSSLRAFTYPGLCGASLLILASLILTTSTYGASVDNIGAPVADAKSRGKAIFDQHCATCHSTSVSRALGQRMLGFLAPRVVYKTLTEGVMRTQAAALSDEDKKLVAQFLTRRELTDTIAEHPVPVCREPASRFDWSTPVSAHNWGLTLGNTREVSESAANLTPIDIPTLELKWAFEYPTAQRARSHPLIAGGAVFVGSQTGKVYALDAATGCVRWTFEATAEVRTGIALATLSSDTGSNTGSFTNESSTSTALSQVQHIIVFGDLLGRVYAVNANSGSELWRRRADEHPATTITGTPTIFENRVYIPVSSLEVVSAFNDQYECCKFRGSVLALDLVTGKEIWRTYTIASTPAPQQKNATGAQNYGPSGAPIWNSPTIDSKRRLLYVGTGENYSSPATSTSDAILAMALDTGEIRWHYQVTPNDAWNTACSRKVKGANCPEEDGPDHDFGASIVLTTDSANQDVLLAPQKSGFVYAIDPQTGKLRWQVRVGRGGLHGGIHFGIATSEGRAFIPISDANDSQPHTRDANPGLFALNIDDGKFLWRSPLANECRGRKFCDAGVGGAITATPSLVFAGALDGYLRIHDASNGKILRKIDTTASVTTVSGTSASGGSMDGGSAPLPFGGRLYVNSGYNFAGHMKGNVLLVFGKPDETTDE